MSPGGPFGGRPQGVLAVVWSPTATLRRVAAARRALPGFVVVALYAGTGALASLAFALVGAPRRFGPVGLPPGLGEGLARAAEIGAPVAALVGPFAVWVSVALAMHAATRLFGGAGPLSSMLGVVGVAQVPMLIGVALGALLAGLQLLAGAGTAPGAALGYGVALLGFACPLWSVALVVAGASLARGIGYAESAGSCALSCVGLGILIILLAVVAGVGAFTVFGAAPR